MLKFYRYGRPIYQSSGTTDYKEAKQELRKRELDVDRGLPLIEKAGRVTFDAAAADLLTDYQINARKSIDELERRLRLHLTPFFGGRRLSAITVSSVRAYIAHRQAQPIVTKGGSRPVSNGEINRELTTLKRLFSLAMQAGRIFHRPHIPLLEERNTRTGFFGAVDVAAVERHLPAELQPIVRFAYITGWRITDEVLPLQWRQVDFEAAEVRLDPETTKSRAGRVFRFTTELRALLEGQRAAHDRLSAEEVICPWVFHRSWKRVKGKRITSFLKAWRKACVAAGLPGRIPHDLRRSAVRTMVRKGVPERVAMQLTGHKTRSVFERYNIVSEGDLSAAATRLSEPEVSDPVSSDPKSRKRKAVSR